MYAITELNNIDAVQSEAKSNWADNTNLVTAMEQSLCLYSEQANQLCTNFSLRTKHSDNEWLKGMPDQYRLDEIFLNLNSDAVVKSNLYIIPNLSFKRGKIEVFALNKQTGQLKQATLAKFIKQNNQSGVLLPVIQVESLKLAELKCYSEDNKEIILSAMPLYFVQLDKLDSVTQTQKEEIKTEILEKVLLHSDITGQESDLRKHVREEMACQIVLSSPDMPTTITKTIDVSKGGVLIDTNQVMIPVTGSELSVTLYLQDKDPESHRVQVMHMGDDTAGLKFLD